MNVAPTPAELKSTAIPGKARALLSAVIAISTDLDLRRVLTRIIEAAADLTNARYGALGVIGPDGQVVDFVTTGLDPATVERIGDLPRGKGILGLLIDEPHPLRLTDLTTDPRAAGFPAGHPPMRTFLGMPIRIRGTVFGNLYLTEKRGGVPFTAEDEVLVQGLASAAGHVIENARAFGESERRRRWLEASAHLTESLQPPTDLRTGLLEVATAATSVSRALASAVVAFPPREEPVLVAVTGETSAEIEPWLAEVQVLAKQEVSGVVAELAFDDRIALVIPLRTHLTSAHVLVVIFDRAASPADPVERELLGAFADQAALALDRALAVAEREQVAVLFERDRIARDLHDVVIQRLFSVGMQLQSLQTADLPLAVEHRLGAAVDELDDVVREIRSRIFALHPDTATSLRLRLRTLVHEYASLTGNPPILCILGPLDTAVPESLVADLLAILRDGLDSAVQQAKAEHLEVDIEAGDDDVRLTVSHDGRGAPADGALLRVRSHAAALDGDASVRPRDPRGSTLSVRIPLRGGKADRRGTTRT